MFENGFMHQAFAFGGEEGQDAFDKQIIYRSSLQNFLIDTGSEVILIDTQSSRGPSATPGNLRMRQCSVTFPLQASNCTKQPWEWTV